MRKIFPLLAAMLLALPAAAQLTRARADQVDVQTNGMTTVVYKNLQLDLQALDTNVSLLRNVTLDPTALTNLVTSATANAVFDLMYSFPAMIDPSVVPALFPTGSSLRVSNLYVPGNVTADTLRVSGVVTVGASLLVNGTVDSTVAVTINETNQSTVCVNSNWLFRIVTNNTYATADCYATNGQLLVTAAGLYDISFSASLTPPSSASNWTAWIETTLSSGTVLSNQCTAISALTGSLTHTGFVGNASYPLNPGATIRALASFVTTNASETILGGGVLSVSRTVLKDAAGAAVTALPSGGW